MMERILLIMSHGSRSDRWNRAVMDFCADLRQLQEMETVFDRVESCFLEHAQPSIRDVMERLCAEEKREVVALPLFLSVGQHVENDIPELFETIAKRMGSSSNGTLYRLHDSRVLFLNPLSPSMLLTENAERRFLRCQKGMGTTCLALVFYGSKKFGERWDELARRVAEELTIRLRGVAIEFAYGGDAVDFSPDPLAQLLARLAREKEQIVVLPELVAVGVLQNQVIPEAIRRANVSEKVIYHRDAILPDVALAQCVLNYVKENACLM
jgi:sirohydrochlorin ferrochelatase